MTSNFGSRIKTCKLELKMLRGRRDIQGQELYKEAKIKLNLILNQREIFWRQRSKQLWLHSGDQNSKYFHKCANSRRRNNRINRLQNSEGQWTDWDSGLAELMI